MAQNLVSIKSEIFKSVDEGSWQLSIVGEYETIQGDLCADGADCISYTAFQKLTPGNVVYEKLPSSIKQKLDKLNEYFKGKNVPAYDENQSKEIFDLNSINPILENHELALVDRSLIDSLHEHDPPYGNIKWINDDQVSDLEAFSSPNSCVDAYNNNKDACLTSGVSCLVGTIDDKTCSCFAYKHHRENLCGYVDLTIPKSVAPKRPEAKGDYHTIGRETYISFGTLSLEQNSPFFSQMMNSSASNWWDYECQDFAAKLQKLGYGAYCYHQKGLLGVTDAALYIYICDNKTRSCYHPEITKNNHTCGLLNCTGAFGELLEGAVQGVSNALKNYSFDTGANPTSAEYEEDQDILSAIEYLVQ